MLCLTFVRKATTCKKYHNNILCRDSQENCLVIKPWKVMLVNNVEMLGMHFSERSPRGAYSWEIPILSLTVGSAQRHRRMLLINVKKMYTSLLLSHFNKAANYQRAKWHKICSLQTKILIVLYNQLRASAYQVVLTQREGFSKTCFSVFVRTFRHSIGLLWSVLSFFLSTFFFQRIWLFDCVCAALSFCQACGIVLRIMVSKFRLLFFVVFLFYDFLWIYTL